MTCNKHVPPSSPALWKPVGPTPGASLLVTGNRLIPQHGPSHSASVTGAFIPGQKESGVCLTVDWNAVAHGSPAGLNTCCFSPLSSLAQRAAGILSVR